MTTAPVPAADATVEMTPEMIKAAESYLILRSLNGLANLPAQFNWHEFYATIVAASPPAPASVGGEVVEALRIARDYVVDALNARQEELINVGAYPKLVQREEARLDAIKEDITLIDAALSSPQPPKGQGSE